MPDAPRRPPPLARHRDVYTEADGLFGRLADLVIENPVRSGGLLMIVLMSGVIVTNAAFFQTARHPDPFFATRAAAPAATQAPAPEAGVQDAPKARVQYPAAAEPASPISTEDKGGEDLQSLPPPAAGEPAPPLRPRAKPLASSAPKNAMPAKSVPVAPKSEAIVVAGLVADTQRALADSHYYEGPVDGRLGPQTRAAISSFEMKIGLIPTGQPSARLLEQIRKGYPPVVEPASTGSIGTANPQLKRIQRALNDIGYGPIPEDGRDGAKTAAAIRHFEADNRLPSTGRASDAVAAKLVMIGAMPSS